MTFKVTFSVWLRVST